MKKRIRIICVPVLLGVFGYWYFLSPVLHRLPRPAGPYCVGTISYEIKDAKHDFTVRCWYPTDQDFRFENSYGNVRQNHLIIETFFERSVPLPAFLFHRAFDLQGLSQQGASLSSAHSTYPVIFFSPGSSISYDYYDALLSDLASHGYIIIGFNTSPMQAIAFPDGRMTSMRRTPIPRIDDLLDGDSSIAIRDLNAVVANFSAALDWLKYMNEEDRSMWSGRMDFNKLFMMGHSFGGFSAVAIAQQNFGLAGCIDLDGWLRTVNEHRLQVPLLILLSDTPSPVYNRELAVREMEKICSRSCSLKTIAGSGHMNFSDLGFLKWHRLFARNTGIAGCPALFGPENPYSVFRNICDELLEFLHETD